MPNFKLTKKTGNPLGGRPQDDLWKSVIVVNQRDNVVTCKRCGESKISRRIDRVKNHMKRCKGEMQHEECVESLTQNSQTESADKTQSS